jgi:SAM-dependent methyltransferase
MIPAIFLLRRNETVSETQIWKWYNNILVELDLDFLSQEEKDYFSAYYREAGLLRTWRRPFFRYHYSRTFAQAASFLLADKEQPLILDLGCGTGTQSLAFALLGAKVIALDFDKEATRIVNKRKVFYEEQSNRSLNIEILNADAFDFGYAQIAPIEGIYSLFAFNTMQPSSSLLAKMLPHCGNKSRIAIQDGNRLSWIQHLPGRRRSTLSPIELDEALRAYSFSCSELKGAASLPPLTWHLFPKNILERIDARLSNNWFWSVSYLALYHRNV